MSEFIPAAWRRRVYAAYAFIGLVVGSAQVAVVSLEAPQPGWLKATLAVYSYVGLGIGAVAASNTHVGTELDPADRTEPVVDVDGNDLEA